MAAPARHPRPRRITALSAVRYGLPTLIVLVGIVFIVAVPGSWEGAAGLIGAGLSVSLLNVLHRMGVSGDRDRDRESAARAYFDRHGHWPEDAQHRP
jgi:hypothetical protein